MASIYHWLSVKKWIAKRVNVLAWGRKAAATLFFLACCLGPPVLVWRINSNMPEPVWPAAGWGGAQEPFIAAQAGLDAEGWQRLQILAKQRQNEAEKWNRLLPWPQWLVDIITVYGLYAFGGFMGWVTITETWNLIKDLPDER